MRCARRQGPCSNELLRLPQNSQCGHRYDLESTREDLQILERIETRPFELVLASRNIHHATTHVLAIVRPICMTAQTDDLDDCRPFG